MWLRRACRGGEKNVFAFQSKRKDVLIKTQERLKCTDNCCPYDEFFLPPLTGKTLYS